MWITLNRRMVGVLTVLGVHKMSDNLYCHRKIVKMVFKYFGSLNGDVFSNISLVFVEKNHDPNISFHIAYAEYWRRFNHAEFAD